MNEPELDRAFAEFAASGDPGRLASVYDALAPELLRVAIHMRGDAAEAEDVLQATFVTAIERAERFERGRAVKPWLLGILAHHARAAARRARRTPDPERANVPRARSPLEDAGEREAFERLDEVLLDLPEAFRPVLVLRLKHGLTAPEIAEALARPPGTVRSQLARGIEALRRSMPATLTGFLALAGVRPARGLDSIREAVMTAATNHAPVAAALTPVVGVLVLKKIAVIAAVLVALIAGWTVIDSLEPESAPASLVRAEPPVEPLQPPKEIPRGGPDAVRMEPTVADERQAVIPPPAAVAATTARLEVTAVYARDGRPARGEIVIVRFDGAHLPYFDEHSATTDENGRAVFESVTPGPVNARMMQGGEVRGVAVAGRTLTLALEQLAGLLIEGEVVDTDGIGVRNAAIWSSDRASPLLGQIVAKSDAAGRFRLQDVGRDRYLAAMAPGRALSSLQAVRGTAGDVVRMRIVVEDQGAQLRGRVLDHQGRPVARAQVLAGDDTLRFDHATADGMWMPGGAPVRTVTDSQGRFEVDGVPLGAVIVQARAPGFGTARVQVVVGATGAERDVTLAPEAVLSGTVTDGKSTPIQGVEIRCGDHTSFATSRAWSDQAGRYELHGLAAGTNEVIAQRFDHGQTEAKLDLVAGGRHTWDPLLAADADPAFGRIRGTVRDDRGGVLAGWNVSAERQGVMGEPSVGGWTDKVGRFNLRVRKDQVHRLLVRGPDEWTLFPRAIKKDVTAGPDEVLFVVAHDAPDAAIITGTIETSAGEPAADALIIVWHVTEQLWLQVPVERTSGRFEIVRVPPGKVQLDVRSATLPWQNVGEREVDAGSRIDLGTIRLAAAGRVTGTLTGAREENLADVQLTIADDNPRQSGHIERHGRTWSSNPLSPGKYTLYAQGRGIVDTQVPFEIVAGRDTPVELVLRDAEPRRVRLDTGPASSEPEWFTVVVVGPDGRTTCVRSGKADAEGIARMEVSVEPGTWKLYAMAADGRRSETTFAHASGSTDEISIRLP